MPNDRLTGADGAELVRLDLYPIHDLESAEAQALVKHCRDALAATGCCSLSEFLTPEALSRMAAQADAVAPRAHYCRERSNAYFNRDDERFPAGHPKRRFFDRTSAFVPADCIAVGSAQRALYDWPPFQAFVQACLGDADLYRYADPLADTIVNVVNPDREFHWHFDTNDVSVSILLQAGEAGGLFEYAPNIRSATDENFPVVGQILDGDRGPVHSLDLQPGDLQIFKGRYSMHRVTQVEGERSRYTAIFSYADQPGMVGRVERTRQLYGKVLPLHLEAARAARADGLLD